MPCKPQVVKVKVAECIDASGAKIPIITPQRQQQQQQQSTKAKKVNDGAATHFRVQGQSWESKGYAMVEPPEVERMRRVRPLTSAEFEAAERRRRDEQSQQLAEAERWRRYFQAIDDERKERESRQKEVDEFAEEDKAKRAAQLAKALMAKHEQDELVRTAERAIGEAKCCAMWSLQIRERQLKEQMKDEYDVKQAHKNLAYQQSKLDMENETEERKRNAREVFAAGVRKQMNDRQRRRFIEEERVQVEARMIRAANEAIQFEKELEQKRKQAGKTAYRNELQEGLQILNDFKRMMCEQERENDKRNINYLKSLEERNAKLKAEHDQQASALTRKQNHLIEVQQKMMDASSNREEMRYLSERERIERKYREDEREAAKERLRKIEDMRVSHLQQMAEQHRAKACFYTQEERELREQLEQAHIQQDKLKAEAEQDKCKKLLLRRAVANQIDEKEMRRRRDVERARFEAEQMRSSEEQRRKNVEMVIHMKLDNLRDKKCLPESQLDSLKTRLNGLQKRRRAS